MRVNGIAEPTTSSWRARYTGCSYFRTCNTRYRRRGGPMRIEELGQKNMLQRIRGEFVEMPGLRLTTAQAQRLWGLERPKCEELLKVLVKDNFLSQTRDGS